MAGIPWHEKWRAGIRLGETAVVIGLWATGMTASDLVISSIMLVLALAVAVIAIVADPARSSAAKSAVAFLLVLIFGASATVVYWRHSVSARPDVNVAVSNAKADQRHEDVQSMADLRLPAPPVSEPVKSMPAPVTETRTVIVQAPPPPAAPFAEPSNESIALAIKLRDSNRENIGTDAWIHCSTTNLHLEVGLADLVNDAVDRLNEYNDTHNTRVIVEAYPKWVDRVHDFFAKNKDNLPDVSVFDLANSGQPTSPILPRVGRETWATMNAKREALMAMRNDVHQRSCGGAEKAAIDKCIADKTCP